MEPEWLKWMRTNMPKKLFEELMADRSWQTKWRDERINKLQDENARLRRREGR